MLHDAPYAAIGGPLALVRDGDMIELDVAAGRLDLCVEPEEIERRRLAWQATPRPQRRGYRSLYNLHVEQADRGCDFDFLKGRDADTLPEGLFDGWVGGW